MAEQIQYTLKHVGLNAPDSQGAQELTQTLCHLFNQSVTMDGPASLFTPLFEIMKFHDREKRGEFGHIGLVTPDVEAAMADLSSKGITFQEDSIRRDEAGKITFIYLEQQIGGFSFHISNS